MDEKNRKLIWDYGDENKLYLDESGTYHIAGWHLGAKLKATIEERVIPENYGISLHIEALQKQIRRLEEREAEVKRGGK